MKRLNQDTFNEVIQLIKESGRPLEKKRLEVMFFNGSRKAVLDELRKYQNGDGGFGNGLEPDFLMPFSSPLQTNLGLSYLSQLDDMDEAQEMIKQATHYLENAYVEERLGWMVGDKRINLYPHTPWWHYNEEMNMTLIDLNYGNPTASILRYLILYNQYVKRINIKLIKDYLIQYVENKKVYISKHQDYKDSILKQNVSSYYKDYYSEDIEFDSSGEVFNLIGLMSVLDPLEKAMMKKRLEPVVHQIIEYNPEKWNEYVVMPIDLVSPTENMFDIDEDVIQANLDFLVDKLEKDKKYIPNWMYGTNFYVNGLENSKEHWISLMSLEMLNLLSKYNRINSV